MAILSGAANNYRGTVAGARNILSGNIIAGVAISGATGNRVLGNFIGTDRTGSAALGNGVVGVNVLTGATSNTVGARLPPPATSSQVMVTE